MKNDRDRKELNKKLIKTTVKSELKAKKKFNFAMLLVDFILLAAGMAISDFLADACGLTGGFLPIFFDLCMIIIMVGLAAIINGKFFTKK